MKKTAFLFLILFSLLFSSCLSLPEKNGRSSSGEEKTSAFIESDSSSLAEALMNDCLNSTFVRNYRAESKELPLVMIGEIEKKGKNGLDAEKLKKDFKTEIIKSGAMKIALSENEADFILTGSVDENSLVDIMLLDCEKSAVVWQGQAGGLKNSRK